MKATINVEYQALWEKLARSNSSDDAIGNGDFDAIGRWELEELKQYGLQPQHCLVDLGCGIGRLAQFAIPYLSAGRYVGIDVAPTMVERAKVRCQSFSRAGQVEWYVQADVPFTFPNDSVDMICAYSVFTHIDLEDSYRYMKDALRIVKPGGKFLYSCLQIDTAVGRDIFLDSARRKPAERWAAPRNIVTSKDMMTAISALAGWQMLDWNPGLGQVLFILQKKSSDGSLQEQASVASSHSLNPDTTPALASKAESSSHLATTELIPRALLSLRRRIAARFRP